MSYVSLKGFPSWCIAAGFAMLGVALGAFGAHSLKDTLAASLDSLQVRGTLVSNGTTSGPVVIDTMTLATKGSLWVTRPAMVHYATPRSHMLAMADELFALVLAGKITGEPQRVLALAEAAEAHRALESRKTTGATVLVP